MYLTHGFLKDTDFTLLIPKIGIDEIYLKQRRCKLMIEGILIELGISGASAVVVEIMLIVGAVVGIQAHLFGKKK